MRSDDLGPLDALDAAFNLPDEVCDDPGLRQLYEVIVHRMRREAQYLPMNTVQQLLIERIAFNYVVLRMREGQPVGSADGFAHATVQKDYNTFWLSMTREFNSLLERADKGNRDAILAEVRDLVLATLGGVSDAATRQDLMIKFSEAFQAAGL
jgi:hypothetical protein